MIIPYRKIPLKDLETLIPERVGIQKFIVGLSSSALVLTFSILKFLDIEFKGTALMLGSWVFFAISIIMGALAQLLVINVKAYSFIVTKKIEEEKKEKKKNRKWISVLGIMFKIFRALVLVEWVEFLGFAIGITLFLIFAWVNFP